jgi:hypothetical protein
MRGKVKKVVIVAFVTLLCPARKKSNDYKGGVK